MPGIVLFNSYKAVSQFLHNL